jgi:hypothetical protein
MTEEPIVKCEPDLPQFEIVLPAGMHDAIRQFLFTDPSREYMGVILAGVCETSEKVKLLGKRFIPVQHDEYDYQSSGGISVQREILTTASADMQGRGIISDRCTFPSVWAIA